MDENGCIINTHQTTDNYQKKKSAADVRVKRMSEQADDAHVRDLQSNITHTQTKLTNEIIFRLISCQNTQALVFLWLSCAGASKLWSAAWYFVCTHPIFMKSTYNLVSLASQLALTFDMEFGHNIASGAFMLTLFSIRSRHYCGHSVFIWQTNIYHILGGNCGLQSKK